MGEIQNGATQSKVVIFYNRGDHNLQISESQLLLTQGFSVSMDSTGSTTSRGTTTPVIPPGTHCRSAMAVTAEFVLSPLRLKAVTCAKM